MINLHSRVSRLTFRANRHFLEPSVVEKETWVLRDDELGGFWGTKYRKYAAITQYCAENDITHVLVTGGINSNNLAAAASLCTEAGLIVSAFAVDDHQGEVAGNKFLLNLLLHPDRLFLIPRSERNSIIERMMEHVDKLKLEGIKTLILGEGGGSHVAVRGCMTLAHEVVRERSEWPELEFPKHIFIDSGTGLSVAALVAGLHLENRLSEVQIHTVQIAGKEGEIETAFKTWVEPVTDLKWQDVSKTVEIHQPLSPRSYGATSSELFEFIRAMARNHGILVDPIYTGKLFMKSFDIIRQLNNNERKLIIHTGGISGLMGFPQIVG